MVAAVLLLVGLVGTLTIVEQASSVTLKTRTREQATSLQRELVEAARSVPYDKLSQNTVGPAIRARPALGDSSLTAAGWSVVRRGQNYTVAVGVCTVDDPGDGIGAHEAGSFCASGSATPADANLDGVVDGLVNPAATTCTGSTCTDTNPADYKRIVSLVIWARGSNVQTSQVNNPGVASAPAVTSLTPATNSITDTRTTLGLTATTTGTPVTVAMYLDGTAISPVFAGGGSSWTDTWTLGALTTTTGAQPGATETLDGSYQLSAKAFDVYGQYGATRSQTIVVNRRVAFATAHVEAGRNGGAVEIQWSPAKEQDSAGFRVERRVVTNGSPGGWTQVCARKVQTACQDTSAPTPATGRSLEYSVIGTDTDAAGAVRDGDRSEVVSVVDPAPDVPTSPGTLAAALVSGNVELTWTAPSTGAADHYNVYRDGTGYNDRLDSFYLTSGGTLKYVDTKTTGQAHDYWITAVNAQLGESVALGPVRK